MIFEYGSHRHPDAEVEIKSTGKQALRSPRGDVYGYDYTMDLSMTLRSSDGSDSIVTLMGELERAYNIQNQRATLYTNSGAIAFRLDPARSLDGLTVESLVYPDVSDAALVTTIKVDVKLQMQAEVANASELIDFQERLEFSGGQPRYVYLPRARGDSDRQIAQSRTPYIATQSGYAIGRRGRPSPPRLAFPNADILDYSIGKVSPRRVRAGVFRDFGIEWSVTFISNSALNSEPTIIA